MTPDISKYDIVCSTSFSLAEPIGH